VQRVGLTRIPPINMDTRPLSRPVVAVPVAPGVAAAIEGASPPPLALEAVHVPILVASPALDVGELVTSPLEIEEIKVTDLTGQ